MLVTIAGGLEKEIQAILFDKDGTLVEFAVPWGWWMRTVAERVFAAVPALGQRLCAVSDPFGIGISWRNIGDPLRYDPSSPIAIGSGDELQTIVSWHIWRSGIPWDEARAIAATCIAQADRDLAARDLISPLPGALAFVRWASESGLALGLVTSDNTPRTEEQLSRLGVAGCFHSVVGRDRVVKGKPDPALVHLACAELAVEPRHVMVIGDTRADMAMGKSAGVAVTVLIAAADDRSAPICAYADLVITDFHQLRKECSKMERRHA